MQPSYEVTPIGVIHSPYREGAGAPIQSGQDETPAEIEIDPRYEDALADLDRFERVWVLTWLDRAKPCRLKVVPYMDTVERGLFSTRAPSRPNPIGLSVMKLQAVRGHKLSVSGCDMLDGTPVLDLKPYAPRFDAFPDSAVGWLAERDPRRYRADQRFEETS